MIFHFADGQINHIYIRSFTEISGPKFVDELMKDTNNVVLTSDLVFFYTLGIRLEINDIVDWEHPECNVVNDYLKSLNATGRFFEIPKMDNCVYFDIRTLKALDSLGYKRICTKFKIDFSPQSFSNFDSILKLDFVHDLTSIYNLSDEYKAMIYCRLFQQELNENDLSLIFPKKKIYWLKTIDELSNQEIIEMLEKKPGILLINNLPLLRRYNYSFAQTVPFDQLPRKCRLTRQVKLKKKNLEKCSLLYTDEFHECFNI